MIYAVIVRQAHEMCGEELTVALHVHSVHDNTFAFLNPLYSYLDNFFGGLAICDNLPQRIYT